jgi:hypothetical protein
MQGWGIEGTATAFLCRLQYSHVFILQVRELFWWKHAAGCHKDSKLIGESDIFIEDDAYRRLQEYEAINGPRRRLQEYEAMNGPRN